MNRSYCEQKTGCKVEYVNGLYRLIKPDGVLMFVSSKKRDRDAYKELHDKHYELIRYAVFERDGYQCVRCGSRNNLQCHHIEYRSQGGVHSIDNCETVCWICHDKEHR